MRFFIDGNELDVQEPEFFLKEEECKIIRDTLDEMLKEHANLSLDKQEKRTLLPNNGQEK